MRLLRTFPLLAFALVLLAVVGFCVAQESVGLLLVCGALAAMSWYVTEGPRGRSLPRWTSNVLVIAVTINVIVDFFQNPENLLGVLGRFVIWLTLIKLYERKGARDYAQLLSLSLLVILIAATGRANIIFGGILAVYVLLGVYVLLAYQLYASHEMVRAARRDALGEKRPVVPSLRPIIGRRPGMHFRSLVTGIVISGFFGSAALFMMFPRGMGGWMYPGDPRNGRPVSGLVDEVNLTTGTRINESRRVVLTMSVRDHNGMTIGNERAIRLRYRVLEYYPEPGRWIAAPSRDARRIAPASSGFTGLGKKDIAPGFHQTMEVDVLQMNKALLTPWAPIAISASTIVRFDPRLFTLAAASSRPPQRYTVQFQPAPPDETLQALARIEAPRIAPATVDPPDDPRYAELAREILRSARVPETAPEDTAAIWGWHRDASQALAGYLSREYMYTLDLRNVTLPISNGRLADPVAHFLFETRRGHCEYFASGLILMCRSIGIPARMIIGYVAMEFDDSAQQFIVRDSNAHAWTEVQTGPRRWREVDPTPAAIMQAHAGTGSLADRMQWVFDRVESNWEYGFLSFDRDAQIGFVQQLDLSTSWFSDAWSGIRDWLAAVNRRFYFGPAGYIWMLGEAAIGIVAITVAWRVFRRWGRIRRTVHLEHMHGVQSQRMLRQLGFYLDMLRALERGQCAKPHWQPPLAFAGTLAQTKPHVGEMVRELTTMFYEARYGGRRLTREDLNQADTLIEGLDEAL